jgi:hypothetical protein
MGLFSKKPSSTKAPRATQDCPYCEQDFLVLFEHMEKHVREDLDGAWPYSWQCSICSTQRSPVGDGCKTEMQARAQLCQHSMDAHRMQP